MKLATEPSAPKLPMTAMTTRVYPNDAGERFWRRVEPVKHKLFQYILKSLSFSEESHDVFQETILRAFQYQSSFREDGHFQAWIYAIAHNEIRRFFQSCKRRPVLLGEEEWSRLQAEGEKNPQARQLYELAARLEPKHREVFFLFYSQGFSLEEIAGITGYSSGYIKYMLNRARNAVRKMLGEGK